MSGAGPEYRVIDGGRRLANPTAELSQRRARDLTFPNIVAVDPLGSAALELAGSRLRTLLNTDERDATVSPPPLTLSIIDVYLLRFITYLVCLIE